MISKEFETRLINLEKAVLQMATNGVIQTQTVDKSKNDITVLKADVASVNDDISGVWSAKGIYEKDSYVMDSGRLFICKIQNENCKPSDNQEFWENVTIASELNKLAALIKGVN